MNDTPESVSFDAQINGKVWRIIVSRELIEDELRASGIPTSECKAWVDEHTDWLMELAEQKIARFRTRGDSVALKSADRGGP